MSESFLIFVDSVRAKFLTESTCTLAACVFDKTYMFIYSGIIILCIPEVNNCMCADPEIFFQRAAGSE